MPKNKTLFLQDTDTFDIYDFLLNENRNNF